MAAAPSRPSATCTRPSCAPWPLTSACPPQILAKPPSADLWPGQTDEGELGAAYDDLDRCLYALVDRRWTIDRCVRRRPRPPAWSSGSRDAWRRMEYKRQMPPVAKLSLRTPGIDHLYPRRRPGSRRAPVTGPGRLLVVGTPIGNLGDLTPRAAEALRDADLVVAEDTRVAARLLAHLGARWPPCLSMRTTPRSGCPTLLAPAGGRSDAGADDRCGHAGGQRPRCRRWWRRRVRRERGAGGARARQAVTAAMALAGVEAPGFVFGGFLPARPAGERAARAREAARRGAAAGLPLVLFESPHRVGGPAAATGGSRSAAAVTASREITKLHEQTVAGQAADVLDRIGVPRGEFTVVVGNVPAPAADDPDGRGLVTAGRRLGLSERGIVEILRLPEWPVATPIGSSRTPLS